MQKFLHSVFGEACLHGARFCARGHCDIGMGFQLRPSVQFTLFMGKFGESPRAGAMVRCPHAFGCAVQVVQICTAHHTANKMFTISQLLFSVFILFTVYLPSLPFHQFL